MIKEKEEEEDLRIGREKGEEDERYERMRYGIEGKDAQ